MVRRRAEAENRLGRQLGTLPWPRDQAWLIPTRVCRSHSHRMCSASRLRVPAAKPSGVGSSYLSQLHGDWGAASKLPRIHSFT